MTRLIALLVILAILIAGVAEWETASFNGPGPKARHGSETVVVIPPHAGLSRIAAVLATDGVVRRPQIFQISVRLRRQTSALKAGEFAIPSAASMRDVMDILIAGKSIQHKVTAAEGLTSQMIYDIVKVDPVLTGDPGPVPAEGTLLPETYLFTRGMTRAAMLARMRKAQGDFLDAQWAARANGLSFKTKEEAVILASIVEKETALPEERRHVGAVFDNRLRLGMKLQSDPTIIYAITKGYPLGRGIRESELQRVTPYNTYAIAGLTPTPICNPGKDSIAAVLNPEVSSDLYFVANGTGGHVFSATVAAQNKNVANWRKIEKQHRK